MNKYLAEICLDLVYPRSCLHCINPVKEGFLCEYCLTLLEFTAVGEHCKRCYDYVEDESDHPYCKKCVQKPSPFFRVISPLVATGPALDLQCKLKGFTTGFISKGLASFMMLYFLQQRLPWPDMIVPLPDTFAKQTFKGKNPTFELAKTVSEILGIPIVNALAASGFIQTKEYRVKKKAPIADKKVLLIGESLNPQFFQAGEALVEGCPHSIMGAAVFFYE